MWAIVVAAGAGNRFGGAKQFSRLGDRCVLDWAVQSAARWCEGVVVVLPSAQAAGENAWRPSELSAEGVGGDGWRPSELSGEGVGRGAWRPSESPDSGAGGDVWRPSESPGAGSGQVVVVAGGVLRSDSVRYGLSVVPDDAEIVLVHDGARPLATDGVYERVIAAVRAGADAAVPVVDVTDTIRWRGGGTADRRRLAAVQTPQAFRAGVLRAAHAGGADATDDATLAEAVGATVVTVDGDSRNLKITEAHDLVTAEALLKAPGRV